MNKFHQIPTDQFVPISHDNSYLFTHYEKVANFLAFNLNKNYKSILAKPVQNGYSFDWFSGFEELINITEQSKEERDFGLKKYWEFREVIKGKIEQLSNSSHEDGKNWASLLTKVFNDQDNFIFSNGKDISIVWGWKFDNNKIYKPDLRDKPGIPHKNEQIGGPERTQLDEIEAEVATPPNDDNIISERKPLEEIPRELEETPFIDDLKPQRERQIRIGFLEFLKWFASKYWWILWLLTFLIAIVFIIKSYNTNY